jgi:dTMP kinase
MKKQKSGFLISFEGGEGGGKTLQTKLLADELIKKGKETLIVREPGGTDISEQIRAVVLGMKNTGIAFTTEVLLFQAARAQLYDELILPSLKKGRMILCDRTRDSSVVYQGIIRGFGVDFIEQLNNISTQKTYPDITFLLDVSVNVGLARRVASGEINRLDMENKEFHERVREEYLNLAKKNDHGRWVVIDASKSIEEVHGKIIEELKTRNFI